MKVTRNILSLSIPNNGAQSSYSTFSKVKVKVNVTPLHCQLCAHLISSQLQALAPGHQPHTQPHTLLVDNHERNSPVTNLPRRCEGARCDVSRYSKCQCCILTNCSTAQTGIERTRRSCVCQLRFETRSTGSRATRFCTTIHITGFFVQCQVSCSCVDKFIMSQSRSPHYPALHSF